MIMNARQFLQISTLEQLHAINHTDYPQFSNVIAALNKSTAYPLYSVISQFPGSSLAEKLYCAINKLHHPPICACSAPLSFYTIKSGYSTYCSASCREADPATAEKRKNTNIKKFGVENAGQASHIKQKIKETCVLRYGVESTLSRPDVRKKSREALEQNLEEIILRTKRTNLAKYGHECSLHGQDGRQKTLQTLETKYGVDHNSKIPDVKEKKRQQLHSYRKTSKFEDEILDCIEALGFSGEIKRNVRDIITPLEIDIFIPSLNLGIECSGCYWHSDPWKPQDYHVNKVNMAEQVGIKLINIFDYEWYHKRDIIEHRLRSALGLGRKIGARQCTVEEISSPVTRSFLKRYHLQGWVPASQNYGLFLDDQLVAVMTFAKPRFNKKYDFELIRYASCWNISGGASKLLSFFLKKNPGCSLITYADRRWSNGNLYEQLGFRLTHMTSPGYWYFKDDQFKHRTVFQKHKLPQLLEKYDCNLGEVENMYENGWRRIFDCGNRVYELLPKN